MENQNEIDLHYLREAIEQSQKSVDAGCFSAGAVVTENNEKVAEAISDVIDYGHAERNAVDAAVYRNGGRQILRNGVLYGSLEPCLMCFLTALHGGINRFVYACEKVAVDPSYYESRLSIKELVEMMSIADSVELVHLQELQSDALEVIRAWEAKQIHS